MAEQRIGTEVSVIGLGRMGAPIAAALLAAGHRTTVWNRTPEKAAPLVRAGAVHAPTVAAAVAASPLVIVPLLDYASVYEALGGAAPELAGRAVVNLTNGSPTQAREFADWAAGHGAAYVDGAMMGLPSTVGSRDAFFLYSGSQPAFDAHRPTLEVLATAHWFGPDPGLAEIQDLALLGTGYAALAGFLHSAALLREVGVPPGTFAPLAASWLRGMAAFLPELAAEAESGHYTEGVSTVDLNRAALGDLIHLTRTLGLDTAVHEPLKSLLDRRAGAGHGSDSFASLFEELRIRPGDDIAP